MSSVSNRAVAVQTAQTYYDSDDADNFYFHVWGGEDIHIGIYHADDEEIRVASERTVQEMAKRLPQLGAADHVLDAGAGYGGAARWLARHTGCRVTCLNLSDAQNERNRELTRAAGLGHLIEVRQGNFEALPFPAHSFDAVWSQDSFLHSPERDRVLEEIDRVLKPGGDVVFTDPMQADDCPPRVLAPVLDRIHLQDLGSFAFYRAAAAGLRWSERDVTDLTPHLVTHYRRVREELERSRERLAGKVSPDYIERMSRGLDAWVAAGRRGHLAWGILHFRKPGSGG